MSKNTMNVDILKSFIKRTEEVNLHRSGIKRSSNRRVYLIATVATSFVLGTYLYSIHTISRSRHLDSAFDELPEYTTGNY
ncbi:unnamed protein product [Dicrocoelium dendriticum]|nr:unnamed protein product [Dicrocoelium dendriticum]